MYLGSWVEYSDAYPVQYRVKDGIVYLRGLIKSGTINTNAIQLPATIAPFKEIILAVTSNNAFGSVRIFGQNSTSAGIVLPRNGNNTFVSLDGISWFIGEGSRA